MNEENSVKNKSNNGIPLIIVILLCVVCLCAGFFTSKMLNSKETKQNETAKKDTNNSKEESEVELTDNDVISKLDKKSKFLYNLGKDELIAAGTFFANNATTDEFTEDEKLSSIILTIQKEDLEKDYNSAPMSVESFKKYFPEIYENDTEEDMIELYSEYSQIDRDKVDATYQSLYGNEVQNHSSSLKCPVAIYDSQTDKYLLGSSCGGIAGKVVLNYNYKYTKEADTYFIYVSVGSLEVSLDGDKVYKDFEQKELYKELSSNEDFTLNESNYQDFSKYRVAFKYDESANDYYFDHVEKLNE